MSNLRSQTSKRLWLYLRPQLPQLVLCFLLMLVYSLLSAATIGSLQPFLDYVLNDQPAASAPQLLALPEGAQGLSAMLMGLKNQLYLYLATQEKLVLLQNYIVLLLSIVLLKGIFYFLQHFMVEKIGRQATCKLRNQLFSHLCTQDIGYFHHQKTGELLSRFFYDLAQVEILFCEVFFTNILLGSLQITVYCSILLWLDWQMAILFLFILPLLLWPVISFGRHLFAISAQTQEQSAVISGQILEAIGNLTVLKCYNASKRFSNKFQQSTQSLLDSFIRERRIGALLAPLVEILSFIFICAIFFYVGPQIAQKQLSPGRFIFFLGALISLMRPIKMLGEANSLLQSGLAAATRSFALLDQKPTIINAPPAELLTNIDFTQSLIFKNVNLTYPKQNKQALSGINLTIPAGSVTALVGPSGSGKSSLCDLLARFSDPSSGAIYLGDAPISKIDLTVLRRHIAIVAQETVLFCDSVSANIAYGLADTDHQKIIAAAKAANAHEFISALPEGYDTLLGHKGTRLSGGQRQRISIARAILKNPEILILDEATSALDNESEALVQAALGHLMQGKTTIVIAHRLSTVQHADRILLLADGQITESGSHQKLMAMAGHYYRLYQHSLAP